MPQLGVEDVGAFTRLEAPDAALVGLGASGARKERLDHELGREVQQATTGQTAS